MEAVMGVANAMGDMVVNERLTVDGVDVLVGRNDFSFICMICDLFFDHKMAFFVFFSAATPAQFISFHENT